MPIMIMMMEKEEEGGGVGQVEGRATCSFQNCAAGLPHAASTFPLKSSNNRQGGPIELKRAMHSGSRWDGPMAN